MVAPGVIRKYFMLIYSDGGRKAATAAEAFELGQKK